MPETEIATRIHILDDNTANQIAAGEVIERPASAVKELVENAIDAGARSVTVELEEAGRGLIRVTDDGCGMSREDAIISLQRHATSKISTAADLFAIRTMGFRGEALPSIASVSRLTMVTRASDAPPDAAATMIAVDGGTIVNVSEIGARTGTSIGVEGLFFNVPARLKFLKTNATEIGHITELMQRFTLANPAVAFRLTSDGHDIFDASGGGSLLDACVEVYGRDQARNLAPMNLAREDGLTVTGYVGNMQTLRPTRSGQHAFVNGRFVRDRAIVRAIDEGYASVQTIHGTKHPVIALMLSVDPALVDVNVSPTKTEVRFTRDRDVFSIVYHAVAEALVASGALVQTVAYNPLPGPPRSGKGDMSAGQDGLMSVPAFPPTRTLAPALLPSPDRQVWQSAMPDEPVKRMPYLDSLGNEPPERLAMVGPLPTSPQGEEFGRGAGPAQSTFARDDSRDMAGERRALPPLKVLAQTRNMYIVAQTDSALVVIDQHIAHERVLYERLLAGRAEASLAVQHLVIPLTLELGRREALVLKARLTDLARAGFTIEPFGDCAFVVRALPATVAQRPWPEAVIRAIVDDLVEKTTSRKLLVSAEEVLITASCKMAIKAGDPLSFEEMDSLLAQLSACANPFTCPHGRPIIIEMANGDLDRRFGRGIDKH